MKKFLLLSLVLCLVLTLFVLTPSAESMDFVLPLQATGASIQSASGTYTVTEITGPNVVLTANAANEAQAVLGDFGGELTVSFAYAITYKNDPPQAAPEQVNLKLDGSLTTGTTHTVTVEADQLDDTFPLVIELRNLLYEEIESVTVHSIHFVGTPAPSPTPTATASATPEPTETPDPSASPEVTPTATPEESPSASPSASPTATPTLTPTPTASPSATPTAFASPTVTPVITPTAAVPTATPEATEAPTTSAPIVTEDPTDEPTPDFDNNRTFGLVITALLLLAIIALDALLIVYRHQVVSDLDKEKVYRRVSKPAFDHSPDPSGSAFAEDADDGNQPRRE